MERQRDMVFCHECENEWYRDEHGLTCPDCSSDFTEIIEAQHDPRHMDDNPLSGLNDHNPWAHTGVDDAPDPEEGDIQNYQWRTNPNGGISMSFSHTFSNGPRDPASPQPHGPPDLVMQSFASMLNGIMGGRQQPQPAFADPHGDQNARPTSSSSSSQSPERQPNTRVFRGGGPNFQYMATTTSRIAPRDANGPQPQGQNFDDLPNILNHMFQAPPRGAGPDPAFAPLGLGGLFANLFNPANMQHGDAVYSQEALDRIISQLMEQNQSGNAPGPASAEAISSLPQKTIAKEDLDEISGKADCSICMDEAPVGSQVTVLPCSHWFHGDCIRAWLGEHDTCPHCRQGIMPRDGPEDAGRPRQPGQAPRHNQAWGQGEGTREDPITVPESPVQQRRASASNPSGAGPSLFSRMRDAFGGGGSPSGTS